MPTFETEVDLAVPAARLWAVLVDSNTMFPKIAPLFIASIDVQEAGVDGGKVGEVTLIKLGPIAADGASVKEKVLAFDPDTMSVTTEELEGGHLDVGFSKWVASMKLVPIADDKVKIVSTVDYEIAAEGHSDVSLAITQTKEGLPMLFHGVEQYLISVEDK